VTVPANWATLAWLGWIDQVSLNWVHEPSALGGWCSAHWRWSGSVQTRAEVAVVSGHFYSLGPRARLPRPPRASPADPR
jgi:hypothetical protein